MATDKEIGERLKTARIAAGFTTAADAATALGIKYPTYAGHENGSRGLRSSLEQYGRRYRVTMDWLLTGRGPGPKSRPLIAPFGQVPLRGYIGAGGEVLAEGFDGDETVDAPAEIEPETVAARVRGRSNSLPSDVNAPTKSRSSTGCSVSIFSVKKADCSPIRAE